MELANAEQAEHWATVAPTWVEIESHLDRTARAPGEWAMGRLDLHPGHRVLDLGCGTGPTTVALAQRVGPEGSVLGVDIAEAMLDRARRRAAEEHVPNVSFAHADVQAADLGTDTYDRAFSRFGVMFYADPVAAFSNVRTALVPGGRLGFVCWQGMTANEWMSVPGMAVMAVTGGPPALPSPGEPGPFSLCDADRVRQVLQGAGYSDVEVVPRNDVISAPQGELRDYAEMALRMGAARDTLLEADESTRSRAFEHVVAALEEHVHDGELRLARGVLVVTARA